MPDNASPSEARKRLLLVDDDPDILDALASALEERHAISTAANGAEALAQLIQRPFDAVILDLMMPVMDGGQLVEELRARDIRVPIVVVSAGVDLEPRCRDLKVFACLPKPFELAALERAVARATQRHPGFVSSRSTTVA